MLVLALDSAAGASVALGSIDPATAAATILADRISKDSRSHAETMAGMVQDCLKQAAVEPHQLCSIITGTGPGPFTGLRIGIMTARTLAFAWQKPLYGLMSLYSLAEEGHQQARDQDQQRFLVASDARRREVYWAEFSLEETGYRLIRGPLVGPARDLPKLPAYGQGAGLYPADLNPVAGYQQVQPQAASLLKAAAALGIENLSQQTSPLYLRESDAQVPQQVKH